MSGIPPRVALKQFEHFSKQTSERSYCKTSCVSCTVWDTQDEALAMQNSRFPVSALPSTCYCMG